MVSIQYVTLHYITDSLVRPLAGHLTQRVAGASVKRIKTPNEPDKPSRHAHAYVVFAGREPGIYNHW